MRPLALVLVSILILWSTAAVGQQKKLVFIILLERLNDIENDVVVLVQKHVQKLVAG